LDGSSTQQYYIATSQSPTDDRARVLKYGRSFFIFDRLGDVQTTGRGEQGLFFEDTRHLSEWMLQLWGSRPLLLSSTVDTSNFQFTGDLANLDVSKGNDVVLPRGTLHIMRSRFLWADCCYEELVFVNHGLEELLLPFNLTFAADFADIFEVRGMHRQSRGERLPAEFGERSVVLGYDGRDQAKRRTRIEWDTSPAEVTERELSYQLALQPRQKRTLRFTVACQREGAKRAASYGQAIGEAREELHRISIAFPRLSSSNSRFNDWMSRSIADVQMMVLGNPEKDYPYAGVPWFGTVFGRDGIITALQTLWLNPAMAKGVLQSLAGTQADRVDAASEAEPGKIVHEMRCGEMAALGEVPFGKYYGTVDATPLFIVLAQAYYERTGDCSLIKQLWPNIERALDWIDNFGDGDGDGFVEYRRRTDKGLVQQGWKDSNDSIFHADGIIAEAPIALCEVQAYVYAAKLAAAKLCRCAGQSSQRAAALEVEAEELRANFEDKFWCDELGTYALALDGEKRPCRVKSSNPGHCLFMGIASPEHARRVANTLFLPESFTGWGIRTVAEGEARYNPLSYHNGSVWPHDNSVIASGLARYGYKKMAGQIFMGLLDLSSMVDLHRLPELFCGVDRRPGEGPTLYPVACSPQAWAAAAPFLILQACLGISIDADRKRIVFDDPYLPEGIPNLSIVDLRCGDTSVDLFLERRNDSVLVNKSDSDSKVEIVTIVS
jgi:glycogen debranching enzyme